MGRKCKAGKGEVRDKGKYANLKTEGEGMENYKDKKCRREGEGKEGNC